MLQFLLRIRSKVEEFELNVGGPYFLMDQEYEHWALETFGQGAQELRFGLHYRRWIRILHVGNPNDSLQLQNILSQLNGNGVENLRNNIHRFAVTMHRIYKIFSNEIHADLVVQPNFINAADIDKYISLLPLEMRSTIHMFHYSGE